MIFRCKPQSDVLLFFVVCVFQVKEDEKTCEVNPQSDVFAVCFYLCMLLVGEVATAACVCFWLERLQQLHVCVADVCCKNKIVACMELGCCFWGLGGIYFCRDFIDLPVSPEVLIHFHFG